MSELIVEKQIVERHMYVTNKKFSWEHEKSGTTSRMVQRYVRLPSVRLGLINEK